MPSCFSGSVFIGVQPVEVQVPMPAVKMPSLGSSSTVEPLFVPFKKSTMVLLRKLGLPPSPGLNARERPFWFVHVLGPTAIGIQTLSRFDCITPPATAFVTYCPANVGLTFDARMAKRSMRE